MATTSPSMLARWTPSPSPTRPLRDDGDHRPEDDIEMYGVGASGCGAHEPSFRSFATTFSPQASHHADDPAAAPTQAEDGKVPNCKGGSSALFLTWEDLCVIASDRKGRRGRPILHGATGYAQPGELLAVMGPSGCGKSTLLDALAGRSTAGRRQSGKILVNGRQQTLAFGTSAYVTQDDILTTTLTVREAVHYSSQLQLPDEVPLPEKKERAEEVIREMGLQEAADTRVGGAAAGGLSGGQKRRLSICLEILTRPRLLFLDEPTSGIDSAASYHVMRRIARLARGEGMTVVAAVHQPCGDVFELFHCLCLLSDGRTVYFGPPSAAVLCYEWLPMSIEEEPI